MPNFYRPQTKLREGNVYTPVYQSFCLQGGLLLGDLHLGGGSTSGGGGEVGHTPPSDTTGYGQRAGGTHPTGMHSCLKILWGTSHISPGDVCPWFQIRMYPSLPYPCEIDSSHSSLLSRINLSFQIIPRC